MTQTEAERLANEALRKARNRVGDWVEAVQEEVLTMVDRDPKLFAAFEKIGLNRQFLRQISRN